MDKIQKFLSVSVYKSEGQDCSNKGLSSDKKTLLLENTSGPYFIDDIKHYGDDYLVIVTGPYDSLRAVPKSLLDSKAWVQFGGNFIYTSDSRFPNDQPIKIFDRVEK